jgi:hypothetical protein
MTCCNAQIPAEAPMSVLDELLGQLPTYSEAYGRRVSIPCHESVCFWVRK